MRKILLIGFLLGKFSFVSANELENLMLYPGDVIGDNQVSEYVNTWWQWTYTMQEEVSPVLDTTGEHCAEGQFGDVWFLAGGYGSSQIQRECAIPQGKHIFFPVINMAYWPTGYGNFTCEKAKESAALNNDELLDIEINLNGDSAWNPANSRMASFECFDLLGLVPGTPEVFPSATDGYWVMLKPLELGEHELSFKAMYDREKGSYSKMMQDIKYLITITE